MKNNIYDKVFVCPKCGNKTLIPVDGNESILGVCYDDLFICEECAVELVARPNYDLTVTFIEMKEE